MVLIAAKTWFTLIPRIAVTPNPPSQVTLDSSIWGNYAGSALKKIANSEPFARCVYGNSLFDGTPH